MLLPLVPRPQGFGRTLRWDGDCRWIQIWAVELACRWIEILSQFSSAIFEPFATWEGVKVLKSSRQVFLLSTLAESKNGFDVALFTLLCEMAEQQLQLVWSNKVQLWLITANFMNMQEEGHAKISATAIHCYWIGFNWVTSCVGELVLRAVREESPAYEWNCTVPLSLGCKVNRQCWCIRFVSFVTRKQWRIKLLGLGCLEGYGFFFNFRLGFTSTCKIGQVWRAIFPDGYLSKCLVISKL